MAEKPSEPDDRDRDEPPGRREGTPGSDVAGFLRRHKEAILHAWEARVLAEDRRVELMGLALRDDLPALLDGLADWLDSGGPPEASAVAASALDHVLQRLDAGLSLAQVLREYRLLREAILSEVLSAETTEQTRSGSHAEAEREARVPELARLNAGLDIVLSQSVEQFVQERDRRAASERASTTRAMQESDIRYRSLFEAIDEGFCLIEVLFEGERAVDYRFLQVNPAFERHTGLKDATGKRMREMVPGHEEHWFETYGRVARTGEPARFQGEARELGRYYDVYAFRIGEPHLRQVAVVFNDTTERKRVEDALRASEELKAFLLMLSDKLRPLSDPTTIQGTVARTAREHFGADRCYGCEIEGDRAVIRQDDSAPGLPSVAGSYPLHEMPLFRAALEAGKPLVVEDAHTSDVLDENLRRLCVEMQVIAFLDVPIIKDGKPVGLLCITQCSPRAWTRSEVALAVETAERAWGAVERARAMAALREANERLIEADRHKNEFLAVLSHELRNPLAPIRNGVYILEHAAPGAEAAIRARRVIERQAQHMTRLIEDLLDVTRISRGKVVLQRERIDLNAIALTTAEDHRDLFTRSGIELQIVDANQPLWVEGDRTRLAQVIGNLLTNSAKFTPRGGKTALSVEARDARAIVRVADDGLGLSPETREHLFEPFVQAAQTLERARGGLGLGLALVKGLVELHGGEVSVHSEGEGKGAEFVVTFPLRSSPATSARQSEIGGVARAQTRRVLVVEDNLDAAETLREALTLGGHEVTLAHSGPEGLEAARSLKPDVVLCDIGLPGLDGYAIARSIRADSDERLRRTLLVALSGYALPEDVARSKDAGFDQHVAKPPNLHALERLLSEGGRY